MSNDNENKNKDNYSKNKKIKFFIGMRLYKNNQRTKI